MTTESPVDERIAVEPFRASALRVSLTVKDLARSTAWYRDVLGFTIDEQHERDGKLRAVSLRAGDVQIVIGQDDGAKGWERVKGEGFSVQFTTEQNIDAIAARIVDRGGSLADGPRHALRNASLRLIDPDGFKLTVASPRAR
jgi:predicted enzyme related to lactoylglutathione lyase